MQMLLDSVTNLVYSNEQVTTGNSGFKQDIILSPSATHFYALTAQQVTDSLETYYLVNMLMSQ